LIGAVERLLDHVRFVGPANVQGFLDGDTVTFIEVNPRFSGGLPLSLAAGADLVGECVRRALGVEGDAAALQYRSGVRMTRWFEQAFDTTPAEADLPAPLRIMAPQPSGEGEGARVRDVVA
jgi:carbamoyl-phosphate synthase large subunit